MPQVTVLRLVPFQDKVNLVALSVMFVSLFGFLGNVMIDYNWGTNFVTNAIAVTYWMTLRWIIPFPLNYWGLGAVVYFVLFLGSFATINRSERPARNLTETVRLAAAILVLFEAGVWYFVPEFMDKWIINAVRNTPLGQFTNWDLMAASLVLLTVSQAVLLKSKLSYSWK